MKSIFTYPSNLATNFIDPNYLGDATSGFYKRTDDLMKGNYKAYGSGINPIDYSTDPNRVDLTIEKMSAYHNALQESWDENTMYQFWNQPLIEARIDRIEIPLTSADNVLDPTPITFTVPATPAIIDGELLDCSNFDSTLISLNGNSYYAKVISSTEIQLSVNSGLTQLLNYRVGTIDNVTSVTGGSSLSWDPAVFTSNGYVSNGEVFLSEFDGTMSKYNDESFYLSAIDSNTFNLSWDQAGTDLLKMQFRTGYQLENLIIDADTGTIPASAADALLYGRTWDTDFRIEARRYGPTTLDSTIPKGANVSPDGTTDLYLRPRTVSQETPGTYNNYYIPTVSRDAQIVVYQSDTAQDKLLEWTGDQYEVSTSFTWPQPSVTPQRNYHGTDPSGRFFWVDDTTSQPGRFRSKVYDLQNAVSVQTLVADPGITGDPTNAATTSTPNDGITDKFVLQWVQGDIQGNSLGYNAFLGDPGHTNSSDGRIFVIHGDDTVTPGTIQPTVASIITNPQPNTTGARFGDHIAVSGQDANGRVRIMATNLADKHQYGSNPAVPVYHEYFEINFNATGNPTVTHLNTLTQNLNVANPVSMNWYGIRYPDSAIKPKISKSGLIYAIGGAHGIQIHRYANGTWSTNNNNFIFTNFTANFVLSEDGNRIISADQFQTIQTWEYDSTTDTWSQVDIDDTSDNQFLGLSNNMTPSTVGANGYGPRVEFGAATLPQATSSVFYSVSNSPARKGYVFARQNLVQWEFNTGTLSDSSIIGKCENTPNVIQWALTNSQNQPSTGPAFPDASILPTATATEYEIRSDLMLQNKISISRFLTPMQLTNGLTMAPYARSEFNIGDGTPSPNSVLENSTTGKITDIAADPEDILVEVPAVVTNGDFKVSLSEPLPYDFEEVRMYLSGNQKYQKRTDASTYENAAFVKDTIWRPGATSKQPIGSNFGNFTITQDASGYITGITADNPPTQRFASSDIALLQIGTEADTYVPPRQTIAEQQDNFDTADEWTSAEFNTRKVWPTNVTPATAEINYNSPTITNNSQSGIKYTRSVGHTKWTLDVTYPPMKSEDFKEFHAISQAAQGQSIPFYFVLQNKDGNSILWKTSYTDATTTSPRVLSQANAGDSTLLLEGFPSFRNKAMTIGEVFIDGNNENGNLHTSINQADANAYGEAKVRVPYPLRGGQPAGQFIYKNPYHVVVTLADDNFTYSVDQNGYYYVSVAFDLDGWK
jgi:hypothetical protein